jgi:hypothetical protein
LLQLHKDVIGSSRHFAVPQFGQFRSEAAMTGFTRTPTRPYARPADIPFPILLTFPSQLG